MNNRSMRLDSECDITIDAASHPDPDPAAGRTIASMRDSLLAEHLGVTEAEVARELARTGSLVQTVDQLRRPGGRTLIPYVRPDLSDLETWLADNEVLDPEGTDEMFEPLARRGLFRRNSLDFRIRHRGHRPKDDRPAEP